MKVQSSTTRLIHMSAYLSHFPPDLPGQLVISLPDDDINELLYHAMPYTWKKKMVEQGYNYLDGSIHSMVELLETRIENLEKSIPPKVPSRNRKTKKKHKEKKATTSVNSKEEDSDKDKKGEKFCKYHGKCSHTSDEYTALKDSFWQAIQKKGK